MEMIYQYLWKHRMLGRICTSVDGEKIEILSPGVLNTGAGPDFSAARLRINGTDWAGNVEVHVKASDWYRHHHDSDPAYDNVILHLVAFNDARISMPDGNTIPQLVASFPASFKQMYDKLSERIGEFPCYAELSSISPLVIADWMNALAVERIQRKANDILSTLHSLDGDWERTCFVTLARALGFSLNATPMEMMARSLPLNITARHSNDLTMLEALLLGQAGLLDPSRIFDDYHRYLCREYQFLSHKYGLKPINKSLWKRSTRPQNFPARRIALLARTLEGGFSLLRNIIDAGANEERQRALLQWDLSGYWQQHFDFGVPIGQRMPNLSHQSMDLLLINFTAPLLYAYSAYRGDYDAAEAGLTLCERLPAEKNRYITQWKQAGVNSRCASESQAIIQLNREYCDHDRCLNCRLGHALLRNKYKEPHKLLTENGL